MLEMSVTSPGGELASLRSLASRTLVNIQSAPLGLTRSEDTVRSFTSLLDRIATDYESDTSIIKSDETLEQQLNTLITLSTGSLAKLHDIVEKSTSSNTGSVDSTEREITSANDADQIHRELSLRYSDFAEFLSKAGIGDMARTKEEERRPDSPQAEQQLILEAVHKIVTEEKTREETSAVLSEHNEDHNAIWKHLWEKLKAHGFKPSDIERYKPLIFSKLHDSLHHHHRVSHKASDNHARNDSAISVGSYHHAKTVPAGPAPRTFGEHSQRQPSSKSNYRPPAASTIMDDSDDDARSVGSDASTLLGPIDDRRREDFVFRPNVMPRPSSRHGAHAAEPISPRITVDVTEEKFLNIPASPRTSGPSLTIPTLHQNQSSDMRNQPSRRSAPAMPRPVSPRERDPGFGAMPYRPSTLRSVSSNMKYDSSELRGQRSSVNPRWRFRRNGDIKQPRNQSMDVQDDALPMAAAKGRLHEVQRLIWEGRNIESFGSRGDERTTALYRAAKQGHFDVAQFLLQNGANPNPQRRDGKSLVRLLADEGAVDMLQLIVEYGANVQNQGALPQSALFGHFYIVQLLLDYGANIEEVEKKQTALYRAASNGHHHIVELLLREGANPHYRTSSGQTPLYRAVEHDHDECARLLLSYGARPDAGIGHKGESILHVACEMDNEQIICALLRRGAQVDVPYGYVNGGPVNNKRRTPLHVAAREGHIGPARLLLEYGAKPNLETEDGRGCVDLAIQYENWNMVDLLSRNGGYPLQQRYDRNRGSEAANPRRSAESQSLRRYSSTLQERPSRERRPALNASRSVNESESKRRSKSSSRLNTATAMGVLASTSLMLLGG